jgi:Zn-dependent protease with chaperone function
MKNNRIRLIVTALLTAMVLGTTLLYGAEVVLKDKIDPGSIIALLILIMVILFMVFFIRRQFVDVKQGVPFEDERSRKVMNKAAAMTFYFSLYWLLFVSFFESFFAKISDVEKLDAGQTVGIGIGGMAIAFFVFWLYYNRKAEPL